MDLTELAARTEIADVLARYARGVDRGDWALVRASYHPDAEDDHGLYQGGVDGLLAFLQQLAGQLTSTTHHLGNQLIEVDGDSARTETYCVGWYHRGDRAGGQRCVAQGVRYLDHLERRSGRWAISRRTVVLDWEEVLPASTGPPPAPTWRRGGRGAADASFQHLTTVATPRGTP